MALRLDRVPLRLGGCEADQPARAIFGLGTTFPWPALQPAKTIRTAITTGTTRVIPVSWRECPWKSSGELWSAHRHQAKNPAIDGSLQRGFEEKTPPFILAEEPLPSRRSCAPGAFYSALTPPTRSARGVLLGNTQLKCARNVCSPRLKRPLDRRMRFRSRETALRVNP